MIPSISPADGMHVESVGSPAADLVSSLRPLARLLARAAVRRGLVRGLNESNGRPCQLGQRGAQADVARPIGDVIAPCNDRK
jgi:hypothetical protein